MTTKELKIELIHKISEINDISFLKAIKTIIESMTDKNLISLSSEQVKEIIASKKEVEQGFYLEQDKLDKEIKGWLSEK